MKKFLIFLMLLCLMIPVSAAAPTVVDNANILSDQQEQKLADQFSAIESTLGISVVVLTEKDIGYADPMDYADDYYDGHGYDRNGVLLLLNMAERDWWISTAGSCIEAVDADEFGEHFVPYLSRGEYYKAFSLFGKMVQVAMENKDEVGELIVDEYGDVTFEPYVVYWYDGLIFGLIIGVVIGGISVAVMAFRMKSVRTKGSAADYVERGSLRLTCERDRYLYQTVTRRAKPKDNGTHRSSSGRSHGGGGGKF